MDKIGFFDLIPEQRAKIFIRNQCSDVPISNEDKIVAYLLNAPLLAASCGVGKDILSPPKIIGPLNIRTDGMWIWTDDVAYYVREYRFKLPVDFIHRMEDLNWIPPKTVNIPKQEIEEVLKVRFHE